VAIEKVRRFEDEELGLTGPKMEELAVDVAPEQDILPEEGIPEEGIPEGEQEIEVVLGDEPAIEDIVPDEEIPHDANLAEYIEESELSRIGKELTQLFDADEQTRKDWLDMYTEGLEYLGFTMKERDQPFKGASGVYHPVLSEAVVRFQSNAIVEIFPAAGPVLTKIYGEETPDKINQAKRVKEELNYQLTENMSEYRSETEKLLFRLSLAGSVFKKVYFDAERGRPCSMMVPAEDFVADYNTSDIETSERHTHVIRRSKNQVAKMMRSGFYRRVSLQEPSPYYGEGKEKEDELLGRTPSVESDTRHVLLEVHVHYNLPAPFDDPDGVADPYIITVEKASGEVLAIRRNWAEGDENRNPAQYFLHYEYMPGLGFYAFGLVHLLGSIAKASTAILRQLIDAGTLANLPGGLKTRGLRTKGGDEPIQPGEWRDVDVPGGAIKDNLFPLPYKEPSGVLAQLLGSLIEEGRRIGSIADMEVGAASENTPVGTTLALLERSLKVMSAVHARLHATLRKELKLIGRVIHEYMPPQYAWDDNGQFDRRADFDGRVDVSPVSDPNAATQAQRIAQMQAVMQLASTAPELYNMKELHRAGLQAIGIKNDERILPMDQDPPRLDPVQENMSIMTAQPVKVYPDQDHTAHLQVHISAMMDPKIAEMVGQSASAARIQGQMEAHIAEHLAMQYRSEIEEIMGVELPPLGESLPPEVEVRISRLVAEAGVRLREKHAEEMKQKKAEEIANDPVFQLREREVALKERDSEWKQSLESGRLTVDIAKAAAKEMMDMLRLRSEEERAGAKIGADLVTFGAQLESEERREGVTLGREIAKDLVTDMRDVQRMQQESNDRYDERQARVEVAKMKKSPPNKTGG